MIFRTFDATTHNRIANIQEVRATIGGHVGQEGAVDFSDCAARPDDFILLSNGSDAASIYERRGPSVLEGHSLFAPSCRGREAIGVGRQMVDWIFRETDVLILIGATPVKLRSARWFNRQIGMSSDGIHTVSNQYWTHDHEWFHLTREEWTVAHVAGSNR